MLLVGLRVDLIVVVHDELPESIPALLAIAQNTVKLPFDTILNEHLLPILVKLHIF